MPKLPTKRLNPHVLLEYMRRQDMSQGDVAREVGIGRPYLNRLLQGRRQAGLHARRKLIVWAKMNGVDPDVLWVEEGA